MRYLITGIGEPFYTEWWNHENYEIGTVVYDLWKHKYFDGTWKEIKQDHL